MVSARRKYDQRGFTPRTTVSSPPRPGSLSLIRNNAPCAEPPCGFSPYASARLSTTVDFPDPFSPTSTVSPAGNSSPFRSNCAMAGTLAGHTASSTCTSRPGTKARTARASNSSLSGMLHQTFRPTGRGASRRSWTAVPRVDAALADRLAIRDVVETWASARDSRDWEAFRACWHEDGYMMATWFQGPKEDSIRVSQEGAARGVNILHFTGGVRVTLAPPSVAPPRAIAQTRMTIMQRGVVDGVLCDVACTGRFYDFFEQRDGRWGIVLRQPIYEKDRLDPVDPAASLTLDPGVLARFPEGYRYLAYLQVQAGYPVKPDMPGVRGPEVEGLYERGGSRLV